MFVKTLHKSALKTGGQLAALAGAAAALLIWPQAVAGGVSRGLSICGTVIIPSLFPFLVLAGFLVRSGVSAALGRRLERPTRFLFGLPGCCAAGHPGGLRGRLSRRGDSARGNCWRGAISPAPRGNGCSVSASMPVPLLSSVRWERGCWATSGRGRCCLRRIFWLRC